MNALKELFKKLFPEKAAEIDSISLEEPKPADKPTAPTPAITPEAAEITALREKIATLENSLVQVSQLLESEQKVRTETLQKSQSEKIALMLDEAVKTGKISPEVKDKWQARLSEDFDKMSAVLADLPATVVPPQTETKPEPPKPAPFSGDPVKEYIKSTANLVNA